MNLNPLNWLRNTLTKESAVAKVRTGMLGADGAVWSDKRYDRLAEESYLKNAIAFRCITIIASAVASVPWELFRESDDGEKKNVLHWTTSPPEALPPASVHGSLLTQQGQLDAHGLAIVRGENSSGLHRGPDPRQETSQTQL